MAGVPQAPWSPLSASDAKPHPPVGVFRKGRVNVVSGTIGRQMEVEVKLPGEVSADVLVLPVLEGGEEPSTGARTVDERLSGRLRRLAESGELRGELGHTLVLHLDGELNAR